ALAPLFAPPAPVFQPPVRRSRRRGGAEPAADEVGAEEPVRRTRRRGQAERAADETAAPEPLVAVADELRTDESAGSADSLDDQADDDFGEAGARRRRRRGRRGRGRGRGGEGD